MRALSKTRLSIFGLILAAATAASLFYFALGAANSFGAAAAAFRGAPRMYGPYAWQPFQRSRIIGVGSDSDSPIIIIQQFQPPSAVKPVEPPTNKTYIQPRWIDGGFGVEVLEPGRWIDEKHAATR